ncbi:Transporter, major facilitator family domain containing protein, related [Eimeria acervulina]|uniref:Transporter, major facilitator family domain containing protein, related n=1 Tax=Eimeria acervulina TaxID=5801 RepID=U6GG67_EIMAC|nr:Transporter, major facilitator family domain containing protein, related [Eimeria acervulina]CDI78298.1 Transporter, major facilitator family domain containing protein, related [Eimeria acervulina]
MGISLQLCDVTTTLAFACFNAWSGADALRLLCSGLQQQPKFPLLILRVEQRSLQRQKAVEDVDGQRCLTNRPAVGWALCWGVQTPQVLQMSAASPKDDDNNSKTSPGRRASVGGPPGRRRSLAPEECLSVPSLPSSPASSLPRAMAGQASKPSTEERFPLVAKGTFQDLETGEGALDAPDGGPPAAPHNLSWGGWRRNSNSCSNSSTERQQQGNTSASQPPLNPQAPTPMTGSSSSPGSRSPSDERFRRWWRFFGLEPLAQEQQRQEQEQPQQQLQQQQPQQQQGHQQQQHPRVDVRFTSVVFLIFFALEIFVNFDCGAIPCTLSRMADEFRLSPTWQGMLGALPYVGLTLMSPFAGRVFAYWPAKRVVVISMALNAFATLLMVLTVLLPQEVLPLTSSGGIGSGENGSGFAGGAAPTDLAAAAATPAAEGAPGSMSAAAAEAAAAATSTRPFFRLPDFSFGDLTPCALLLLSSRLLVGLTQAPFVIFAPVWVDEFAPPKKAALWMGIMQGAAVVGVTVGYLAAGVLSVYLGLNWRSAICFQVFFLFLLTGLVASIPWQYVQTPGGPRPPKCIQEATPAADQSNDEQQQQDQQLQQREGEQDQPPRELSAAAGGGGAIESSASHSPQAAMTGGTHRRKSADAGRRPPDGSRNSGAWPSPPSAGDVAPAVGSRRNASLKLLLTPMYMLPVLTLCALLFVVTGVQFWGTIFFASFLGLSPAAAVGAFAAVAATSPVVGVLMGGLTVDAVGGYKTLKGRTRTLVACTAYAAIAVACAVIGSFSSRVYVCVACLWLLLCFGAAMLPPLTGIQIDAVSPDLRTLASGISMFFYNILGYALGAFLPGVAMDLFHGGDVLGLRLVLLWSVFGLVFSLITALYAWKLERKETAAASRELELSVHPTAETPAFTATAPQPIRPKRPRSARGFVPITVDSVWQQQQQA